MELFGKYFVFEVRVFIKILEDKCTQVRTKGKKTFMSMSCVQHYNTYKIYSVA